MCWNERFMWLIRSLRFSVNWQHNSNHFSFTLTSKPWAYGNGCRSQCPSTLLLNLWMTSSTIDIHNVIHKMSYLMYVIHNCHLKKIHWTFDKVLWYLLQGINLISFTVMWENHSMNDQVSWSLLSVPFPFHKKSYSRIGVLEIKFKNVEAIVEELTSSFFFLQEAFSSLGNFVKES